MHAQAHSATRAAARAQANTSDAVCKASAPLLAVDVVDVVFMLVAALSDSDAADGLGVSVVRTIPTGAGLGLAELPAASGFGLVTFVATGVVELVTFAGLEVVVVLLVLLVVLVVLLATPVAIGQQAYITAYKEAQRITHRVLTQCQAVSCRACLYNKHLWANARQMGVGNLLVKLCMQCSSGVSGLET